MRTYKGQTITDKQLEILRFLKTNKGSRIITWMNYGFYKADSFFLVDREGNHIQKVQERTQKKLYRLGLLYHSWRGYVLNKEFPD